MIRVLIVEDSQVVRDFLTYILESDPAIAIVGAADNGVDAIEAVSLKKPDIITMDINMPRMNGLEATRRIMETTPTPIIIVSGSRDRGEVDITFSAIEAGALAVVPRPVGIGHPDFRAQAAELVKLVKSMSEVKVVTRTRSARAAQPSVGSEPGPFVETQRESSAIRVIAIGASTGGPMALKALLGGLSSDFSIPILIVQHTAKGFTDGFSDWLGRASGRSIRVARPDMTIESGETYVAPDDRHLEVSRDGRLRLSDEAPVNGLRPSVASLFRSVADSYGPESVGVLLTGMGRDGAAELKLMRERGAMTIAQDEASSVVYGMPGEAKRIGAAKYIMSPEQIAATLVRIATRG